MKGNRGEQVELYLCPLLFTYEGRFINKLQNIILLIFKIWIMKIRKYTHFVGNLIGDVYRKFYDDDVTCT